FPSNSLFDVTGRARLTTNGQFHWADGDVPLWFIPFGNGVPAVRISDIRDCMFYVCNCGGQFSRYEDVQCYPHADQQDSIISCATLGDHSCPGRGIRDCAGSVAILPCEETERDPGLYYEHYPGGVLIQTHKIKVVEPADFTYPNNTVDFIYIEGEGIYLKSDYERYQQKED